MILLFPTISCKKTYESKFKDTKIEFLFLCVWLYRLQYKIMQIHSYKNKEISSNHF